MHVAKSPKQCKDRIDTICTVLLQIQNGLEGKPFSWGDAQRRAFCKIAEGNGFKLVSLNWINQNGYKLKRGASPAGSAYFGAPIKKEVDLYVLSCQCVKDFRSANIEVSQ